MRWLGHNGHHVCLERHWRRREQPDSVSKLAGVIEPIQKCQLARLSRLELARRVLCSGRMVNVAAPETDPAAAQSPRRDGLLRG